MTPEASLYNLLARLLSTEIDADFLALLHTPDIREIFEQIHPNCLNIDLEEAATEYCRLFILPRGVPALASAWLPGDDPNKAAPIVGLVHNLKSTLTLSLPEDQLPDHAAVLLPLMAWLLDNQPEAAKDFHALALCPWIPAFATALKKKAKLPIYQATAEILRALEEDPKLP
jgi:TorA maturation chaperone TorD